MNFYKKHQKGIESILVFTAFSLLAILIGLNNQSMDYDRIWVFHMLEKVANGDLIYKEINVIVGPIFYLIGGLFF